MDNTESNKYVIDTNKDAGSHIKTHTNCNLSLPHSLRDTQMNPAGSSKYLIVLVV